MLGWTSNAILVTTGLGGTLFLATQAVRVERTDKASDETAFAHAFWDTFEEIGMDILDERPEMEETLKELRWREVVKPSIFHTVGDIVVARYKNDLRTEAVCDEDNLFLLAVQGNPAKLKTFMRALVDAELSRPEQYAETKPDVRKTPPSSPDDGMGIGEVDVSKLYPSHKPRRFASGGTERSDQAMIKP